MSAGTASVESSVGHPQKATNRNACTPEIPLLVYIQGNTMGISERSLHPARSLQRHSRWPRHGNHLSAREWVSEYIHTARYYSALKNKVILPLVTAWIELKGITRSEIRQRKKYGFTYIEPKKKTGQSHRKRESNGSYKGLGFREKSNCSSKDTTIHL